MAKQRRRDASRLGALEVKVMNVLWETEGGTVQDVVRALRPSKELAYTTVMTVLSRLVDKGFLAREKTGRAFVYRPIVSRASIADSALRTVIDRFFDGVSHKAVAHLLGRGETLEEDELARLEAALRRKGS